MIIKSFEFIVFLWMSWSIAREFGIPEPLGRAVKIVIWALMALKMLGVF